MEIKDLQGKLVAVLGFGMEGRATAAFLMKHGIRPTLFDQKPLSDWGPEDQSFIKSLRLNCIFGPDCFKELAGFDVAFRSPGISLHNISLVLPSGVEGKLRITSQTKWFFEHCPAKIIGITGTKGKGTTSSLIYEMLHASRFMLHAKSYLTGNIGKVQPLEILDNLSADDWVVYELSSFQLQDLTQSPRIGVVLMVTGEHLDYHKNIKEYRQAKCPIVKFQKPGDTAIINHDFPASMAIGAFGKGQKLFFSRIKALKSGCFVKGGKMVWNFSGGAGSRSAGQFPVAGLQLRGRHNLENVCAAVLAGLTAGCPPKVIKDVLKKFKGLEHRLEFVAEKKGVKFFNDSFSTTPETCLAAIESFSEPEILILGGSSKNSDFKELGRGIRAARNIKAVILIGQEAKKIKSAIQMTLTPNPSPRGRGEGFAFLEGAKNMREIFAQVKSTAKPGDVVLLSPACASFDMFKSYVDRGNQFKLAVKSY